MNNEEIKEILEELEDCKITKYLNYNLDNKDARIILDYITNLQEEIEELKKINESHQKLNGELREEISKLENKIHALEKHNEKLQLEAHKYFDLLMECEYGSKK